MAGKEIGKRRKMWQKPRTILHKSTIALTLTSTVRVWRNRNFELHYTQIWCCFIEFGSNRCLSNHILFNPGMESDFYPWWCEQTLVPSCYFLQVLRCILTSSIQTTIRICTFVAKELNKKQTTWNSTDPKWLQEANHHPNRMKKTIIGACSQEREKKQTKSGRCMLKIPKSDSQYCTININLNSAKIWFDISKMKPSQCSEIRDLIPCSNNSPYWSLIHN